MNFFTESYRRHPSLFAARTAALVLSVSFGSSWSAWAQSATATLNPNPIRIDAYARYSIRIEDGAPSELPLLHLPPEIQVVPGSVGTQREITVVNGQQKDFITFIWTLTVDREGEFTIPEQEVTLTGDRKLQTNAVKVTVSEKAKNDDQRLVPTLTLEVGKVKFYEGEQVPITARLTTHRQAQIRRFHLIEMPKQDFAMQRFPLQAQESLSNIGGEQYIVRDYTTQMNALKAGTFELGPATMDIVYEVPDPAFNFGGQRSLFVPTETQSTKARSNTVRVEVLPLPKENRPASFKGAIGRFKLQAQATPLSVKVGEPISVDLQIEGAGNFDALSAPELSSPKGWKVYPAKRVQLEQKQDVSDASSTVGFNVVIIPTEIHTEIPAFELTYFDPESAQYITARTQPIPLQVQASDSGAANAPASSASNATDTPASPEIAPPPAPVRAELQDIVEIDGKTLPSIAPRHPALEPLKYAAGIAFSLLLPFAFLMYLLNRGKDPVKRREAQLAKAKKALRSKSSTPQFFQNLLSYLDLADDQSPAAHQAKEQAYAYLYHPDPQRLQELSQTDRDNLLKSLKL